MSQMEAFPSATVEQQSLSAHDITDNVTWTLHAMVLNSIDFLTQKYTKVAGGNVSTRDTIVQTYYIYIVFNMIT